MPMMEGEDGVLYCTTKAVCEGLGIVPRVLDNIRRRHADELSDLRSTNCGSKDFLLQNKDALGLERVRNDMRLWTEDDMLMFAIYSRSGIAKDFRRSLIQFIKENARKGYVPGDVHARTEARLSAIEEILASAGFALSQNASTAGKLLNQQKDTKRLRLIANQHVV